jgi:hypothetical protein
LSNVFRIKLALSANLLVTIPAAALISAFSIFVIVFVSASMDLLLRACANDSVTTTSLPVSNGNVRFLLAAIAAPIIV